MPTSSKKQHNFMAAIANNPSFAKKAGVPQSVGKDFIVADKGKKIPGSGSRPDLQRVNSPKTNQGKNELFKKGGDIMAKSDMKMDKSQDKAMIQKAFKQHDSQEHKGGKGTSLKLAKGGKTKRMADGGMGGEGGGMSDRYDGGGGYGGGAGGGMRGGMGRNAIQAAKQAAKQAIRTTNQQNRAAAIAARQAAKAATARPPAIESSGPIDGYGRGDGGGASSGGGGGDGGGGGGMKRGGSVKKMAGGGYTVPSNGIMDKGGAGMKRGGSVKKMADGGMGGGESPSGMGGQGGGGMGGQGGSGMGRVAIRAANAAKQAIRNDRLENIAARQASKAINSVTRPTNPMDNYGPGGGMGGGGSGGVGGGMKRGGKVRKMADGGMGGGESPSGMGGMGGADRGAMSRPGRGMGAARPTPAARPAPRPTGRGMGGPNNYAPEDRGSMGGGAGMKRGGSVKSFRSAANGVAQRGKTRGKMI